MRRKLIGALLIVTVAEVSIGLAGQATPASPSGNVTHVAWVAGALERMKTIKAGMTRKELLTVFTTEGGLSTSTRRTFVSRDCPYFKVDVVFRAAGRPERDVEGRVTATEADGDVIVSISKPFVD